MTKRPFTTKGCRAKECLELVHIDVCRPFNVHALGGYEYFITFMDDYSKFGYVYLMHKKSDALDKFIELKAESKNQLGKRIKVLRSNRVGEYMSTQFDSFLKEHEIISQLSAPGTPQKNGVGERRNRTFVDMVRLMMIFSSFSVSFWEYALDTIAYLLNLVPSKSVPLTPTKIWKGHKPSLQHIHI